MSPDLAERASSRTADSVKLVHSYKDSYDRILVPLDGTPLTERALRPAVSMASRIGASVHLVAVHPSNGGSARTVEPAPPARTGLPRERGELEEYLEAVHRRLHDDWHCPVTIRVLTGTDPAEAIVQYAESVRADLAVAATHSRQPIGRALLGSTVVDLVRSAPCPVLLVPSAGPDDSGAPLADRPRSIVAALDPSRDLDDVVLGEALVWAGAWKAQLDVVQVVPLVPVAAIHAPGGVPMTPGTGVDRTSLEGPVSNRLGEIVTDLRRRGFHARAQALTGVRPADAVAAFAESIEADLVVVGQHEKGLVGRLLMGSESDRLSRLLRSVALIICPLTGRRDHG